MTGLCNTKDRVYQMNTWGSILLTSVFNSATIYMELCLIYSANMPDLFFLDLLLPFFDLGAIQVRIGAHRLHWVGIKT